MKKMISMNYGSSANSSKLWRWVRIDLILLIRDIYIDSKLNPLTKFTSSSRSIMFKDVFFFYQGFIHRHWRFTGQKGKGGDHLLFNSTTSTRSRTMTHLFATLHVRWLSRIFNCNACVYQTATRWVFPVGKDGVRSCSM